MASTNHERVGKALTLLRDGLAPFVEREMAAVHGARWSDKAAESLRRADVIDGDLHVDVHGLLLIMWDNWNDVFRNTLGHAERSLVSELREVRNAWAHQKPFSLDDTYRALDSVQRLLTAISAPEAAEFAADLGQVHRGEGSAEYADPREFYRRTFLTEGLARLLAGAGE